MAHQTSSQTHGAHPLGRPATIDAGIIVCGVGAVLVSFAVGNGAPAWRNIAFPPLVIALAAVTIRLVIAEIRAFARTSADSRRPVAAIFELLVALVAMVVVGPMLVIMPVVFLGAIT